MIRIDRAVIVEGKYDKIKLENIIEATIIPTNGFSLFKDSDKKALIKKAALQKGLVVLTDSDSAGNMIRAYLKNICQDADIINVYVPQIKGKEKRKRAMSSSGVLGVEGLNDDIILHALERAGVTAKKTGEKKDRITKQNLFSIGLSGGAYSKNKRESLSVFLDLPRNLSSSAFLDAVNTFYTKQEFESKVELWRQEADKK